MVTIVFSVLGLPIVVMNAQNTRNAPSFNLKSIFATVGPLLSLWQALFRNQNASWRTLLSFCALQVPCALPVYRNDVDTACPSAYGISPKAALRLFRHNNASRICRIKVPKCNLIPTICPTPHAMGNARQ